MGKIKVQNRNTIIFKDGDSWVLLAVIYTKNRKGADLSEIIASGDMINHAIFTWQELQGGLYRLLKGGYILESSDGYRPSEKTLGLYGKILKKTTSVLKQMELLSKELNVDELLENYDPAQANQDIDYPPINERLVNAAYCEYKEKLSIKKHDRKKLC